MGYLKKAVKAMCPHGMLVVYRLYRYGDAGGNREQIEELRTELENVKHELEGARWERDDAASRLAERERKEAEEDAKEAERVRKLRLATGPKKKEMLAKTRQQNDRRIVQNVLADMFLKKLPDGSSCFDIGGVLLPDIRNDSDAMGSFAWIFPDQFLFPLFFGDTYERETVRLLDCFMHEGPYSYTDRNSGFDVTVGPGDVVLDAGAWIGDFSAWAARKGAMVYAFEPGKSSFNYLKQTCALNRPHTILPFRLGLSDRIQSAQLCSVPGNSGGAQIRDEAHGFTNGSPELAEEIVTTTIDAFVREQGLERVDFIKADIEGAERQMLLGATETLRQFAPKLVLCTYHFPDDPDVLEELILRANPGYRIVHLRHKLFAWVPESEKGKLFIGIDRTKCTGSELRELEEKLVWYAGRDIVFVDSDTVDETMHDPVIVASNEETAENRFYALADYHARGWELARFANYATGTRYDAEKNFRKFMNWKDKLGLREKAYVFGTGPSLDTVASHKWDDGYRIACNQLVKDKSLWHAVEPDMIVAADAIHHFGPDRIACEFRKDLMERLEESQNCMFAYPEIYEALVTRYTNIPEQQRMPLRRIHSSDNFHKTISEKFSLPCIGNILGDMLIPIACALSKNIFLFGFDGRAPNDRDFWAHSRICNYDDLYDELKTNNKAFFDFLCPSADRPEKYNDFTFGVYTQLFDGAINDGYKFTLMHSTHHKFLQRFFRGGKQ